MMIKYCGHKLAKISDNIILEGNIAPENPHGQKASSMSIGATQVLKSVY